MTAAPHFPAPIPPALISDPLVPLGRVLLTGEAWEVLAAAVHPASLRAVRCHQVACRLGESLSVSYECVLVDVSARRSQRLLVARAGGALPSEAVLLSDGSDRLAVWSFPDDPFLPGLAAVLDQRLSDLLAGLGLSGPAKKVEVRSYLPGRRAVVEVATDQTHMFFKAVRPHTVKQMQDLYRRIGTFVPLPRVMGAFDDVGLFVTEAMSGHTLQDHLARGGTAPDPASILDLLEGLPQTKRRNLSLPQQARQNVRLLSLLLPDCTTSLENMMTIIEEVPDEPSVPVHGDLHAGQIFIDEGRPSGLIDVDRAGMGNRGDDLGSLIAHLKVIGNVYHQRLSEMLMAGVDHGHLRLRIAAAVLGFAPAAFIAQQRGWPEEVPRRIGIAADLVGV